MSRTQLTLPFKFALSAPEGPTLVALGCRIDFMPGWPTFGLLGVGSVQLSSRKWWRRWIEDTRIDFLMSASRVRPLTADALEEALRIGARRNRFCSIDTDRQALHGYVVAALGPIVLAFRGPIYEREVQGLNEPASVCAASHLRAV